MRKLKLTLVLFILMGLFIFSNTHIYGDEIIDPPIITINKDLPTTILIGLVDEIDFTEYFIVRDNKEPIDLKDESPRSDDVWWFIDDDGFKLTSVGVYNVTLVYNAKDGRLYEVTVVITVTDKDLEPPIFTSIIQSEYKYEVFDNDDFSRLYRRFEAKDAVDGDMVLTSNSDIINIENVDINTLGSYEAIVRFTDKAGNVLEENITIIVKDTKPPTILLKRLIVTKKGEEVDYLDLITFKDNYNKVEDLEIEFTYSFKDNEVDGVDYNKPGEHRITVTATDSSGNHQSESFRILVEDGLSFGVIFLIINGILVGVAAAVFGIRYILKVSSKR